LKRVQLLFTILFAFILISTSQGLLSGDTKESLEYKVLSLEDVRQAFAQKDLKLMPLNEELPVSLILEDTKPYAYTIANSTDQVLIYVFDSIEERDDLNNEFKNKIKLRELFWNYRLGSTLSEAKNVLIVFCPGELHFQTADPVFKRAKAINDLVFTDLNKGRILVFRGEGRYWEAQVIYRYTINSYKNKKRVLKVNNWKAENQMARYKGENASEVGPIIFSVLRPHGSNGGTGFELGADRIVRLSGSDFGGWSSGALNSSKDIYTITIEWNGQQETFNLKAYPDKFLLFPY
jgi:hypothetical protein